MTLGLFALVSAAIFFGAALYVLFVEHVARESIDDRAALSEWKPARQRGGAMQVSIALIAAVLGLAAWWKIEHPAFLIGAILAILPLPWTLLVIKPTDDQLLALSIDQAGAESRILLRKWGRQHGIRAILGGLATVAFVVALVAIPHIDTPVSKAASEFSDQKFMGQRGSFYPDSKGSPQR